MKYPFLARGIKNLRISRGLTKQQVAETLAVSLRTLERIESGENCQFSSIFDLFQLYKATPLEIARIFSELNMEDEVFGNQPEDLSPIHFMRLKTYENMCYNCYYVSTKRSTSNIEHLSLKTSKVNMKGYVPGRVIADGYEYMCKIVSPIGNDYTYLYLTSTEMFSERAFAIFPFDSKTRDKIMACSGRILSLSSDRLQCPCYQKILMISSKWGALSADKLQKDLMDFLTIRDNEYDHLKLHDYELFEEDTHFVDWVRTNIMRSE